MSTEKTVPKVSPASQCVMGFGMGNLIFYTVSAIVWTDYHLANNALLGVQ